MSKNKAIPRGLKDQEVERGIIKQPTIPYILVEDGVKKHSGNKDYTVKLPNGTDISHFLFDTRSHKAFMIHVQEVLSFCDQNQKGYFRFYAEAEQALEKAKMKSDVAKEKLEQALEDLVQARNKRRSS